MSELADYLAQNYGHCSKAKCTCRVDDGWNGRACPYWVPVSAKDWLELAEKMRLKKSKAHL